MINYASPPCKDCTGRYIGCHSGCPTWQQWKAQEDARKAEIRKRIDVEQGIVESHSARDRKIMRKQHADMVSGHKTW